MTTSRPPVDPAAGVYSISTAAGLLGVAMPTLRLYEEKGLVSPARTDGGTRRYSPDDLDRLHRIGQLVDEGVNLTGIAMVLRLEAENRLLAAQLRRLRRSTGGAGG